MRSGPSSDSGQARRWLAIIPEATMRRAIRDAVAAALGYTLSDEEIEAALASLDDKTIAELEARLRRAEAAFANRGGRGVELADEIDRLRIVLAARGAGHAAGRQIDGEGDDGEIENTERAQGAADRPPGRVG